MTEREIKAEYMADLNERFPCGTLTVKQLAEYLQLSTRTIMRMLYDKQLLGKKARGQWRFTTLSVANYMTKK